LNHKNKEGVEMNYLYKSCFLVLLTVLFINFGGADKKSIAAEATRIVTPIQLSSATNNPSAGCDTIVSDVGPVSNNGVVAGYISVKDASDAECRPHVFTWSLDNFKYAFSIVPFPVLPGKEIAQGERVAVLSTNKVTGGITFGCMVDGCPSPDEFAAYNTPTIQSVISGWNYVFGISENGAYIVGTNLGGQPLLFNTLTGQPIPLTLAGAPLTGSALDSVSNTGVAVGSGNNNGLICGPSGTCQYADMGSSQYSASIRLISSDGSLLYGVHHYQNNRDVITKITKEGSGNYVVSETSLPYAIFNSNASSNVTNKGAMVVTEQAQSYYIALPDPKSHNYLVYSVDDLLNKLHLGSSGIAQNSASLSPNGKYLAFTVNQASGAKIDVIGYRLFFNEGIESYLINNLSPVVGHQKGKASIRAKKKKKRG
jgi:hypothetical protein